MADAIAKAEPEVIIHEPTSIPAALDMRHFDRDFAQTKELRARAIDTLLVAGQAVGVEKFIAQSFFAAYARTGGPVEDEEDPLEPAPLKKMAPCRGGDPPRRAGRPRRIVDRGDHASPRRLLRSGHVPRARGGGGRDGAQGAVSDRRRRQWEWSFLHIADVAEASLAAVERGRRGIYNITDGRPARVAEWLSTLAEESGRRSRCACHDSSVGCSPVRSV